MECIYNEEIGYWTCGNCGMYFEWFDDFDYPPEWFYCPICGIRMGEEEDDE